MSLSRIKFVPVPLFKDGRGALRVLESGKDLRFDIRRVYYLSSVEPHAVRGGHAHHKTEQVFFCVAGTFTLGLTDGFEKREIPMTPIGPAVQVPAMIWDKTYGFSDDAVCAVMANRPYESDDYIRDWTEFLRLVGAGE